MRPNCWDPGVAGSTEFAALDAQLVGGSNKLFAATLPHLTTSVAALIALLFSLCISAS